MTARSRTALKAFFERGDKPTQTQFSDLIDSMYNETDDGSAGMPYTLAVLTINQSGTSNPTLTTIYNNSGHTFTATRSSDGRYVLNVSGSPDLAKAVASIENGGAFFYVHTGIQQDSNTSYGIWTDYFDYQGGFGPINTWFAADSLLTDGRITIKFFP